MDALILSCGTGGGHNSACHAVEEEFISRGHRVITLDPYTLKDSHISSAVNTAYNVMAQRAPLAFGMVYGLGNAYRKLPFKSPVYHINRGMASCLDEYIRQNGFDAVITTHLFPAEILTNMKSKGCHVPKSYFIATDYVCIPFTEETALDYYIIPSKQLTQDFVDRGIPSERILPFGIPVRGRFSNPDDRKNIRERLGMDPQKKYILLAGGSIGAGNIEKVVSMLTCRYERKEVEIIVICGSNHALYKSLLKNYGQSCTVMEFTSNMADYMKACDLFISKPGGLSSTEAAVAGTALIHITPIPGCETLNVKFFERNRMCCAVSSLKKQLIPACDAMLDEVRRRNMCFSQHGVINPHAARDICDFIERRYNEDLAQDK